MRKIIWLMMILILILIPSQIFALTINSPNAILIDADTGRVLFEKNADESAYPASTTKIMTAILTLEHCNLDDEVTASYAAVMSIPSGASNAAIQVGEVLTVKDLLQALLVCSANEAANILAEHVGGSVESFVSMMNTRAAELGATNTHFVNANGLHDDNHYSTARDMAIIAKYAMDNFEAFRDTVSIIRFRLPITAKYPSDDRFFLNSNQLIVPNSSGSSKNYYYEYTTGIKTGYTSQAKNCLVASASKDKVNLLLVVLGAGQDQAQVSYRYTDAKAIFNYGFDLLARNDIVVEGSVVDTKTIADGKKDANKLEVVASKTITTSVDRADLYDTYEPTITYDENVLKAPISKGDHLGTATYKIYDTTYTVDLIANNDIEKKANIIAGIFGAIGKTLLVVFILAVSLFCVRAYNKAKKKKRRARSVHISYNSRWR